MGPRAEECRLCGSTELTPFADIATAVNTMLGPPDAALSRGQLDALLILQVGELELRPEGRKKLRTHMATERSARNRRMFLRSRAVEGRISCDACGVDLAERYGKAYAETVELHHLQPLARGARRPKGLEEFALLCPTCHRVVHHRREEPLEIDEVRRLIAARG